MGAPLAMPASLRVVLPILITLLAFTGLAAQECRETVMAQITAALEWSAGREFLNEVMDNFGEEGEQILGQIAADDHQSNERRGRAIWLLGEHHSETGKRCLLQLLDNRTTRCAAIRAIQEYREPEIVPHLVSLLDDESSCSVFIPFSTPENKADRILSPISVSDEAVYDLEQITVRHLRDEDQNSLLGHRATQPWKDWWNENQIAFAAAPSRFISPVKRNESQEDDHYGCSVETIAVSSDG